MRLVFTDRGWEDYQWFVERERKLSKRINALVKDVMRSPFEGIGKPEPLKADLSGYWSRRINDEHRLVYAVRGGDLVIIACRYHYSE
ncbi:MAG TPA: Txe/YoeB family addiction module toxin [Lacipirellulaceae bacterium]